MFKKSVLWTVLLLDLVFLVYGVPAVNTTGKAFTVTLSDGNEIPVLGLGTWGGEFKTSDIPSFIESVCHFMKRWMFRMMKVNTAEDMEVQRAVEVAIDYGYRHIDTAAFYGNEVVIGRAIQNKIQDGTVKREDLFITAKLWNDRHRMKQVVPGLKNSLKKLNLDYVDLYLIHWPVSMRNLIFFDDTDYVETWKGMEVAKRLGLTRSIGVSNFNETQLQRVLDSAEDKPVINQIEVNPNFSNKKLIEFCKSKGIEVTAYSPLGSMPKNPKKNEYLPPPRIDDPQLMDIGRNYNKTTVQVVLRYLIDRGLITIPKSITPKRIKENIDIFDFNLTPEEIEEIDKFNVDIRVVAGEAFRESIYNSF